MHEIIGFGILVLIAICFVPSVRKELSSVMLDIYSKRSGARKESGTDEDLRREINMRIEGDTRRRIAEDERLAAMSSQYRRSNLDELVFDPEIALKDKLWLINIIHHLEWADARALCDLAQVNPDEARREIARRSRPA